MESIFAGKCIDLAELPPAKGRSKNLSGALEGRVVLLHATDYFQSRRLIPDLATWVQCFAIYMAIILTKEPVRAFSLLKYMSSIAKLQESSNGLRGWYTTTLIGKRLRKMARQTGRAWIQAFMLSAFLGCQKAERGHGGASTAYQ